MHSVNVSLIPSNFSVFFSVETSRSGTKNPDRKRSGGTQVLFWGGLDGQSAGYDKHRFVAVHGGIYCALELISDNCAGNH